MNTESNSIKNWAEDDRPREKFYAKGAASLSDSELIAILLRSGTREKSAVEIAKELMHLGKNNLQEIRKLSIKELMSIKGIGETKAITLSAALELGLRCYNSNTLTKVSVSNSKEVAGYLQNKLKDFRQEVFSILYLNRANKILDFEIISQGGLTSTVVDIRILLKKALEQEALSIILCHNHPSGNLQPSQPDIDITKKISQAASFLDIKVIDHIIVSDEGYYSFSDEGMI